MRWVGFGVEWGGLVLALALLAFWIAYIFFGWGNDLSPACSYGNGRC